MIRKKPPPRWIRLSASKFAPVCTVPPAIHRAMGTIERGGTVRFSIGAFNTDEQIDAAVAAVASIIAAN